MGNDGGKRRFLSAILKSSIKVDIAPASINVSHLFFRFLYAVALTSLTFVVVSVEVFDLSDLLVSGHLGGRVDPQATADWRVPRPTLIALDATDLWESDMLTSIVHDFLFNVSLICVFFWVC